MSPPLPAAPPPLVEGVGVARHFEHRADWAQRLVHRLGRAGGEPGTVVRAVDGVDIAIAEGEVVGLVGESGCGKSTLGRVLAGLLPPSAGHVRWQGSDRDGLTGAAARAARLGAQVIFQDPMSSLNPRLRVVDLIGEAPVVHGLVARRDADAFVATMMQRVGLDPGLRHRHPHQFSGGQRQRIGIARALAVQPRFLVCDEAVAALDVSIQAQILNLFADLRQELGLTYLFISHDLGVVRHLCDRVVVMYLGRVVEAAPAARFFAGPTHPYARALLANLPDVAQRARRFAPLPGEVPSPLNPPGGCAFHPRCPHASARCRAEAPALESAAPGHLRACHVAAETVQSSP